MPYQNTLSFSAVNEIHFTATVNSLEIYVNNTLLGVINGNYPATVFITISNSGAKTITLNQITNQEYVNNNNNDPNRTIYFDFQASGSLLRIKKCNDAENYKITGWEDVDINANCIKGVTKYFDINAAGNFKAKIETINNQSILVVRYGQDVNNPSGNNPLCAVQLFSYSCEP